jgi:hypothetical protein
MLFEHVIYSAALAILVGMVFYHYTGRDSSWIIILCAWAPDAEGILDIILRTVGFNLDWAYIFNIVFHTVAAMIIFGLIMAFLLQIFGMRFADVFFFSIIGYGAHLLEDAVVYKSGYFYLWPFVWKRLGIGLIPNIFSEETYVRNFFGIANADVFIIGMAFLLVAIVIRTWYEGPAWIRWYMPATVYERFFGRNPKVPGT